MKLNFMPKTRTGKLSVVLIIIFFLLFVLFQLFVFSGQEGGETFLDNLLLSIPILLAAISGISSFFAGLISIVKTKERSILVYLATLIGFLILLFILGEIMFFH